MSSSSAVPLTSLPNSQQGEEYNKKSIFKLLLTLLFFDAFLVYLCLLQAVHPIQRVLLPLQRLIFENPSYPIEDEIVSTTTRVIFTRSKRTNEQICLKLWQRYDEKVFKARLVTRRVDYLLEGLEFNRRFAKKVYVGIAPVKLNANEKKIQRGRLIKKPEKDTFKLGVEYALVMRRLPKEWQLEYQLSRGELGTRAVIKFLAEQVAQMHSRLDQSPPDKGSSDCVSSKLAINKQLFQEALHTLASTSFASGLNYRKNYGWVCDVLDRACRTYTDSFEERRKAGHIKRCHGDLKATNLWVDPGKTRFFGLLNSPQQLLALDCVDFNPD